MSLPLLPSTGFKPRHTPGPWHIENTASNGETEIGISRAASIGGHSICLVDSSRRADQLRADAELIAEAPALLYQLRNLIDAITHAEQTNDLGSVLEYRDQALKAVAKHLTPSR
jgi:hypothetical protein